ncbi:MAG: ribbon-helix-helix protein, CopG family [Solirubrobacterales bacterium]
MTVSLPREMAAKVEKTRKAEQRTRSELVREALRTYFDRAERFPVVEATPAEIRALTKARLASLPGDRISLVDLRRDLELPTRRARAKRSRSRKQS